MNAGSVGPRRIFLMPRYSSVSRMHTAFCSYQESTMDSGRSFTPQPKATSYLTMGILVNGLKYTVREPRPYNPNVRNSFPSGHTATAFMGAELVRMEYKDASVWYGLSAYVVASGIGVLRVWNERHWATDVLAGAGIGILSARVAYWLLPFERRLFGLDKKQKASDMVAIPYYSPTDRSFGASLALTF